MLVVLAAAVAAAPEPGLQNLLSATVVAAIITALGLVVQVGMNKKLRTPADRTEETKLLFEFYRQSREDAITDKKALEQTANSLRATVDDLQSRSDRWFTERSSMQEQITDLRSRIGELEDLIRAKDDRLREQEQMIEAFAAQKSNGATRAKKETTS